MSKKKQNQEELCDFNRVRLIVTSDVQSDYHLECIRDLCKVFHFKFEVVETNLPFGWVYPEFTINITYIADNHFLTSRYAEIIRIAMIEFMAILDSSVIEQHPIDFLD